MNGIKYVPENSFLLLSKTRLESLCLVAAALLLDSKCQNTSYLLVTHITFYIVMSRVWRSWKRAGSAYCKEIVVTNIFINIFDFISPHFFSFFLNFLSLAWFLYLRSYFPLLFSSFSLLPFFLSFSSSPSFFPPCCFFLLPLSFLGVQKNFWDHWCCGPPYFPALVKSLA